MKFDAKIAKKCDNLGLKFLINLGFEPSVFDFIYRIIISSLQKTAQKLL